MTAEKGLLTVGFGTSAAADGGAEAVEKTLREAFCDRRFYRAWTSGMLRRKLEQTQGIRVLSVDEALELMEEDGVTDLLVQPTHLIPGVEFQKILGTVTRYAERFETLAVGRPLISCDRDAAEVAAALEEIYGNIPKGELLMFMGHGSSLMQIPVYEMLAKQFRLDGYDDIVIGTVEAEPGIVPVLERIRRDNPSRVHLAPLLLSAGGHVLNDMCGDGPDSWKNRIAREGVEVICHQKGLGEYEQVRDIYVEHARRAQIAAVEDTEWI